MLEGSEQKQRQYAVPGSIFIVRHGEPDVDWKVRVDAKSFRDWTNRYDAARLVSASPVPAEVVNIATNASRIFCSSLSRSRASCDMASGVAGQVECSSLFDEVRLVMPPLAFVRFSPARWVTLSGIMWRLGYCRGVENRNAVRARAGAAVDLLIAAAQEDLAPVVLFGHGAMNRFLRKALQVRGWQTTEASAGEGDYLGWSRHEATPEARP
jgi:broad specificity phosphatase PhoE